MKQEQKKNFRQQLKNIFKGYRHVTRKLSQQLTQLGFHLENGKNHYKIYYGEDRHHAVSISKTSSDYRAGMRIYHDLCTLVPAAG